MLSFQKDGHTSVTAVETDVPAASGTDTPDAAAGQSPAGHKDDFLTVAGHEQKLKQSTLILLGVFVVGALSVWMMIKKAVPAPVAATEKTNEVAEIETVVAQLNGMQSEVSTQMKSVTARLNHLSQVGQVDVKDLCKNPFTRQAPAGQVNINDPAQRKFVEEQIRRNAEALQLWTINVSPQGNSCMINEKLLHTGDVIEGFTIKQVRSNSVVVEQDGITVELKME